MCGSVAGYWTRAGGGAVVVSWTFLTLSTSAGGRYQSRELFSFLFSKPRTCKPDFKNESTVWIHTR